VQLQQMYKPLDPKGIQMKIRGDDIPLQCYDNDGPIILTIEQIRKLLSKLNYLWMFYINRYWWKINGYADSICLNDICTRAPQNFFKHLHTRGPMKLTKKVLESIEDTQLTDSGFEMRAYRVYECLKKTIPSNCIPFHSVPNLEDEGCAYQLYQNRNWLAIADMVSGYSYDDVDWISFKKLIDEVFLGPDSNNK